MAVFRYQKPFIAEDNDTSLFKVQKLQSKVEDLENHMEAHLQAMKKQIVERVEKQMAEKFEKKMTKKIKRQMAKGKYLEVVLREVYSHPSVNGIMLWTAMDPEGCYQMCLTDPNFQNLPAGDVVDKLLLKEWSTGVVNGQSDEDGTFSFDGFLGEYNVNVDFGNRTSNSTFFISKGDETTHFSIQL